MGRYSYLELLLFDAYLTTCQRHHVTKSAGHCHRPPSRYRLPVNSVQCSFFQDFVHHVQALLVSRKIGNFSSHSLVPRYYRAPSTAVTAVRRLPTSQCLQCFFFLLPLLSSFPPPRPSPMYPCPYLRILATLLRSIYVR